MDLTARERANALRQLMLVRDFVCLRAHQARSVAYLPQGAPRIMAHGTAWVPLNSGIADASTPKEDADRRSRPRDEEFVNPVSFLGVIALAEHVVSRSLRRLRICGRTNASN